MLLTTWLLKTKSQRIANLSSLVPDIQKLLTEGEGWSGDNTSHLSAAISKVVDERLRKDRLSPNPLSRGGLRMSSIGQPCQRKLWYENNVPLGKEEKDPALSFKFLYGDIIEELVLELAVAAGHEVTGIQDSVSIGPIKGHRDCVIDGVTVDVKSASAYAFGKFREHKLTEEDPFGYLTQLGSYVYAAKEDPLVEDKEGGAFLAIDKTNGSIVLDYYNFKELDLYDDIPVLYESRKAMVKKPEPPDRSYLPEPEGKAGNQRLQINCVYCKYNKTCYPSLRVFQGKGYQKHLVKVNREPILPEVK